MSIIALSSGCSKAEPTVEAAQPAAVKAAAPAVALAGAPAVALAAAPAVVKAVALAAPGAQTKYGAGVSLPESVTIAELKGNVDKYEGKEVRVEGMVTGVCPKRGCWFDMAGEAAGEAMRFKVKDGVMVFPMEANGKYAVAQGVVRKMPMTLEQSKRWATYQRDSYGADLDPDAITEPLTIVRLDGSGAMIRDAK
jgi:hypothetical protein